MPIRNPSPSRILPLILAVFSVFHSPARAASVTSSPSAPVMGADDIANFGLSSGTDKWWVGTGTTGAAKGQTFTTGNAAVLLKSITYQTMEGTVPTKTYVVRVGTVAGPAATFTQIASETATQSAAWATGDYVTWTFTTPVLLQSNTVYGIDVCMSNSTAPWQNGIPYLNFTDNVYPGGVMYNSGTAGVGTATLAQVVASDRVFHLHLDKPITPNFTLAATSPANNSTTMLATNPLLATFSRTMTAGTGNLTLRNLTDATAVVIPIGDSRIAVAQNLLTINPGSALAWGKSYAVRIDPGALVSDTAQSFAGITDDTTWTFTTATSDPLLAAIGELKSHITGAVTLSAAQITADKLEIDADQNRFATSAAAIAAAFDLITTFDAVKGALWVVQSLPARASATNDNLNWVIYNVMQDLMDLTYTATNLANQASLLNGFKFGSSANFPGACAPPADPNQTYTATLTASYPDTFGRATQGDGPGTYARKPTGCYLAPGSITTVTVPQALVGKNYRIRVGAHSWDFTAKPYIYRLDRSTLVYSIDALQTKIANPLGGGIYIEVPFLANDGVVSVQIQNAVRSPYFSAKTIQQTTPTQWLTERANPGPWADFQTDKFMAQVPTSWIYAMADPTQLMADWDSSMDAINDLMGFPHLRGKETMYLQVDLELKSAVYAPGYPTVNDTYSPTGNYGGNANCYIVTGPQHAPAYAFHEQGHSYFFPKFGGETESTINLLNVAVQNQKFGASMDDAFRTSVAYGNCANVTTAFADNTAVLWMTSFDFSPRKVNMGDWEKAYQPQGHAKFVDIARLFGWGGLNAFWYYYNLNDSLGVPNAYDNDSMTLQLCKSVGKDVRPLLHFWGILPVNPAALSASIAAAGLTAPPEIKNLLLRYKSLVPANNAAYQAWCNYWYGGQPSINGYGVEREHARQWDGTNLWQQQNDTMQRPNNEIYVETSAADIQASVQQIIDLYYPDTTPPAISTLSPADNATGVAPGANLVVTFGEYVAIGSGNITIRNLTDATQSTIAVTDAGQVSLSGSVLTINTTADLLPSRNYAIHIDAGAIKDLANNPFAGIADDTTWNFTTAASHNYWAATASGSWAAAANWSDTATTGGTTGAVPSSDNFVVFNQSSVNGAETVTLDANQAATSITFNNTGATTLTGGGTARTLTLGTGGITLAATAGAVTLGDGTAGDNVLLGLASGAQTWTNNSASALTINDTAAAFTRATGATLDFIKASTGNFNMSATVLPNVNSIIGPWAFYGTGGTMTYAYNNAGTIAAYTATTAGTWNVCTSATTNYTCSDTLSRSGVTTACAANTFQYTGTPGSSHGYTVNEASTSTFTVNGILCTGGTGNTVQFSQAGGVIIGSANELVIAGQQNVLITAPVSNAGGALTYSGTATLTLGGANTYGGVTTVNSGTLVLSNNLALQNSALVTTSAGAVNLGVTTPTFGGLSGATGDLATLISTGYGGMTALTLNPGSGSFSYGGAIANGAAGMTLTKTGAGTQILAGANTYTGGTTIANGTLQFAKIDAMPAAGAVAVGAGTTLAVNAGGTFEFSDAISGNGSIGGLLAGLGGQPGGTVTYAGAVTLGIDTTHAGGLLTYAGVIGDVGTKLGFTKLGTGTLTLSNTNSYTGATTVSAGTLQIDGLLSGAGAAVSVAGGTLGVGAGARIARDVNVSSGTVNLAGALAGTLTVTGGTVATSAGSPTVTNADFSNAGAATVAASTPLAITGTLKMGGTTATLTGGTSFTAQSANLASTGTASMLTLSGGTLALGNLSTPASVSLTNPSFETDAGTANSYKAQPITGWTATCGTYVEQGTSRVFSPAAPLSGNGGKWACLQGAGTFSQTITVGTAGNYTVSFAEAGRPGSNAGAPYGPLYVQAQFDSTPATAVLVPSTSAWTGITSNSVYLTAGSHALNFVFTNPLGGDKSSVLDAVSVTGYTPGVANLPAMSVAATAGSVLDLSTSTGAHTLASLDLTAGDTTTALSLRNGASVTLNGDGNGNAIAATGSAGQSAGILPDVTSPPSLIIASGMNVAVDSGVTLTVQSVISGGQVTKTGGGTLALTGTNSYTGATTISGGTLALGASGTLSSGTAVFSGAPPWTRAPSPTPSTPWMSLARARSTWAAARWRLPLAAPRHGAVAP